MKLLGSARHWVIASVVSAIITSFWGISAARVSQDNAKVRIMTQRMKTVCVGRFLIELPENTKVRFSTPRIAGVTIHTKQGYSDEQLKSEIEEREKKLSTEKNEFERSSLEKKLVVDTVNFKSTLLYFARTKPLEMIEYGKPVQGTEEGITVEALETKNGMFYRFFGEDMASPRSENNVLALAKKFEALDTGFIPQAPGFCIKNGLVHDPLTPEDNETITMFASIPEHPDIVIRFDTSINLKNMEESLFDRETKNDIKRSYASHFKSLRFAKRTLNGIEGEEVGDKIKELNGTSAHSFMWVGLGKMRDVLAPSVMLELHTGRGRPGNPRNSNLSDEAVLQLWDRISSSLRLRPTSSPSTNTSPPNVPLGEFVATGFPCPQTGFWKCTETEEIEGSRQRFFKTGEQMSHVTRRVMPNIWQKLRGEQPARRTRTMWKLVAYEKSLPEQVGTEDEQMVDNRNANEESDGDGELDGPLRSGPDIADNDRSQS